MDIRKIFEHVEVHEDDGATCIYGNLTRIEFSPDVTTIKEIICVGDIHDIGFSCEGIIIPETIEVIEPGAFSDIESLDGDIEVDANNKFYKDENNVIFTKDGKKLIYFPQDIDGSYTVPDGTEEIVEAAFYYSSLDTVIIPESVKAIGITSFLESNVTICGKPGSYAEEYADENDLEFMDLADI